MVQNVQLQLVKTKIVLHVPMIMQLANLVKKGIKSVVLIHARLPKLVQTKFRMQIHAKTVMKMLIVELLSQKIQNYVNFVDMIHLGKTLTSV